MRQKYLHLNPKIFYRLLSEGKLSLSDGTFLDFVRGNELYPLGIVVWRGPEVFLKLRENIKPSYRLWINDLFKEWKLVKGEVELHV